MKTASTTEPEPVSSAPAWAKWHDFNARCQEPLTQWTLRATALAPGDRVLDLAAGTGLPSLAAAHAVRPGGRVIATDSAADMLAVAERNARAAGLDNITFEVMDAHELRFEDAAFDAVTCNFGLMFFRDPVAAVREIRRVLVPGGRFAILVWDMPESNPFFTAILGAIQAATSAPPPDPNAPGPFRFAAPGALEAVVRAGGLSDVAIESVSITYAFESFAQHWSLVSEMTPPLRNYVANRSATEIARLRSAIQASVATFAVGDGVHLTATALCASGRRS